MAKELHAYLTLSDALGAGRPSANAPTSVERDVLRVLEKSYADDTPENSREALRRQAIEMALPIARTMARRYQQRGEPADDLEQVASLGLVKAVNGYDPARGSGFLAYAVPTILGELRRHFRDYTWSVRPPRALQELQSETMSAWSELSQRLGHAPAVSELAEYLVIDDQTVREAIGSGRGRHLSSLDASMGDTSERTLHDILGGDDDHYETVELRLTVRPLIDKLPARCREVLALRMTTELTQAEIGDKVGLSQMGVSRCLARTLASLHSALDGAIPPASPFQRGLCGNGSIN
jgi:RNA polymerase sigma-B factor